MKPRQTTANNGKPSTTRPKHPAAVALGKLGKGRPKTMTPAAITARQRTAAKRRLTCKLPDEQLPPGPLGAGHDDDED